MNKDFFLNRIVTACDSVGLKPTPACIAAGVGKDLVTNIKKKGTMPSVDKVADLAAFLNVSVSDLVGDAKTPADLAPLADAWAELSDEGRARLVEYAEDLVNGGRYKKHHLSKEA